MKTHCPVPQGTLVVIGGKENKGEDGPDNKKNLLILSNLNVCRHSKMLHIKENLSWK